MVELLVIIKVLLLLGIANGTPIIAKKVLGKRLAMPLDGGVMAWDGRPLFGSSKTVRGLVLSIMATTLAAPLLGVAWTLGAAVAAISMLGDLFSSFMKRRMGQKPHSQALGLDQIPESLLPLLVLYKPLGLATWQVIAILVLFFVLELLLSRLLYRLHLRDRPY